MMDNDENVDALSAKEKAYFESGGTIPMPGWEEYPDISLGNGEEEIDKEGEVFSAYDNGEGADDLSGEDDVQEKIDRPSISNPQGDAIIGAVEENLNTFAEGISTFEHALHYLARRRDAELAAFGFADGRMQDGRFRAQRMKNELEQIIMSALAGRRNPAAMIYEIACGYGFRAGGVFEGGITGNNMTLEKLATISEQDFGKWYETNEKTFRQLMGG